MDKTAPSLIGAKSKAIEIQSQYAEKAYDIWVAEASKLGEIYAAVARDAYKPLESGDEESVLARSHLLPQE
ncbi:MAG TPA: phasin family protein [Terrimicrobiaceae bacterium]|nr:phasin family protein [Terrimicrobiaceae bacterium]